MKIASYIVFFMIGFCTCAVLFSVSFSHAIEVPFGSSLGNVVQDEAVSPTDYMGESDIMVYSNMVVLMVEGASISRYANSGSMRPVIDSDANGIRVVPKDESEIMVGDIVTFKDEARFIVHRVVEKGVDESGVYFVTQGDNNDYVDSKIRFSDIRYKTIGVLY